MSRFNELPNIRQEYGVYDLLEKNMCEDPLLQFEEWFSQHLEIEKNTPNAMVLSTVDQNGYPDSRVVLLKELDKGQFVFYTNYNSVKGLQLNANPHVALNFYWPTPMRQVRVRGIVSRTSSEQADEYFYSRPITSQLSTLVSLQSSKIGSREELDQALSLLMLDYADKKVPRPSHWGGFAVTPYEIEFWQGRDNRLHDRIQYSLKDEIWSLQRLAP